MKDPESGVSPPIFGVPAAPPPPEKGARAQEMPSNAEQAQQDANPAQMAARNPDRPESAKGGIGQDGRDAGNGRKRRRRRRRRKGSDAQASGAQNSNNHNNGSAGGQGAAHGGRQDKADSPSGGMEADQARHGRQHQHKSNSKRAYQGRPLANGMHPPRHPDQNAEQAQKPHQAKNNHPGGQRTDEPVNGASRRQAEQQPARPRDDAGKRGPLYAALDLGTNNCRLLVAQPTRPGQFRVVDAFSRIVRLGEGLGASGKLSQDAMDRAVEALRICASKLRNGAIRNRRLIATEACRSASNGAEFLARVKSETGLDLEVVDRETEARLAVSGCASLIEHDARKVVLFDIGGGSSEIAIIEFDQRRSNRLSNHIKAWTSLPVGVVTLSEQHGGRIVTPDVFDAMVRDVEMMLESFDYPAGDDGQPSSFHLLGTSGTVTTLAGVFLDLPRYDRRRVDGLWLSRDEVDRMQARLLSWDFAQRSANPCIGADRADLVLAGCAILEAIRKRWPAERMRVADRGLREGLLTEMMAADGIWRRPGGRRRHRFSRPPGQGGDPSA